ncbi:hypothetical protein J2S70_000787 [Trueperella bonasi]|uniref:DUF7675 domain-containing protein n=1 Tax=Trueperella bonasi TaxID=312286 RepID=A0ABT9NG98_9ACTO|nr:hypothetical protein [Trueperella bonasi]MDP9806205.1 hypothetical protein [Trueperella bonasi]
MTVKSNQFISDEALREGNQIWDVTEVDEDGNEIIGLHLVTFDKENVLNLFSDYPHNFTAEQVEIFKQERPFWAEFFANRTA